MAVRSRFVRLRTLATEALADLFDQSSPFGRLALVQVLMLAGDTLVTISLAGSLFFSISPQAAKSKVLLYLLLTIAPFAIVSPLLGPLIDRSRNSRRAMVVISAAGRAILCPFMARDIHNLALFPEAFLILVLSKLYLVTRGALVSEIASAEAEQGARGGEHSAADAYLSPGNSHGSPEHGLAGWNAQLTLLGTLAGFVASVPGVILLKVFGAPGVLIFTALVFVAGAVAGFRLQLPRGSELIDGAPGEPEAFESEDEWADDPDMAAFQRTTHPEVVLGLTANSLLRGIAGFLVFLLAFGLRRSHAALWWYGLALTASGIGALIGLSLVPRLRRRLIEPQIARVAKELFVFQRTPAAVGVRNQQPTDVEWFRGLEPGWQEKRIVNFTQAVTGAQPEVDLVGDGWTELMWVDTQRAPDSEEAIQELERSDFETMEKIRRRIDEIVQDPQTAEKLKPYWGKHCKRVCFHDEYLPAFNRPNVHLVDTDGRGVEAMTALGPVVDGVEYPVDLLIYASGFEVTTDLHQRLGFDPKGRNGVALSERWAKGAHTLHGVLASGFPNLLLISLVQGGFGTNFSHLLSESAKHVAHIVDACVERGIAVIEPEEDAEDAWLAELLRVGSAGARYFLNCTPSFYNSEQQAIDSRAARNLTYSGSLLDYVGHLERWREEPSFAGVIVEHVSETENATATEIG